MLGARETDGIYEKVIDFQTKFLLSGFPGALLCPSARQRALCSMRIALHARSCTQVLRPTPFICCGLCGRLDDSLHVMCASGP